MRLTPSWVFAVLNREKDDEGRLRLAHRDPPAWVTDEFEGYRHYLWHIGITNSADVRRLYGAYQERRARARADALAAARSA
jgi:hypothetical protein